MVSERVILKSFSKKLEHLGVIAAIVTGMGIVDLVNERLPKLRHHKLTHGDVVLAIILNGLGFTQRRLYLFPAYFENKAVRRLFGKDIDAKDFTDDVVGRTLDAIKEYGPEKLFQELISQVFLKNKLGYHRVHLDTTNFSVHGAYHTISDKATITIEKGYPKDGRWELNRFGIGLIVNQIGVPLFMQLLSGSDNDKVVLPAMLDRFRSQVEFSEPLYCIADSAFYTEKTINRVLDGVFYITLVPGTVGEQQELLTQDLPFTPMSDPRYSYYETESVYGGVPQKLVMFLSEESRRKEGKTLEKHRLKEEEKIAKALVHLKNREFACEKDAITEAHRWIKEYPHYEFEALEVVSRQKRKSGGRGRPKKEEEIETVYAISARITLKGSAWTAEQHALGRFVLATNDLSLSPEALLAHYKNQNVVERGFRFLKDKSFEISDVFLKNVGRIEALGMLMVLMLAVYSLGEYQLRSRMAELNATVSNQLGKPTSKPTLKWVMTFFDGVIELYRHDPVTDSVHFEGLLNMTDRCWDIVELFGPDCEKYYS
ncbi:MAG: IS1634 family transposase [Burkholderiaceae bacterium]|jgi:transposase|nr:IS1634 family transposase [Burkholderiaceae bacterium]